jgi:tetratricopeptide (TPR) repeat protein
MQEPVGQIRELVRTGRFAEALQIFRTSGAETRRPDGLLLAATAATRLGELAEARRLAEGAAAGFRARGDRDGSMRTLNLLGVISFEQGRLEDSDPALRGALGLAHELADSQLAARASNNLASLMHLRGHAPQALSLYRGALVAYQRLGDRRGTAETFHNLALVFRQMEAWSDAENAAEEALRHAEIVGDTALIALVLTGYAEIRLEQGKLQVAEAELERTIRLGREAEDELGVAEAQRVKATCAIGRGDFAAALGDAEAAHAVAATSGAVLLRADAAAALALALRGLGRVAEAEQRRAEAMEAYRLLGARHLIARFERAWSAGPK